MVNRWIQPYLMIHPDAMCGSIKNLPSGTQFLECQTLCCRRYRAKHKFFIPWYEWRRWSDQYGALVGKVQSDILKAGWWRQIIQSMPPAICISGFNQNGKQPWRSNSATKHLMVTGEAMEIRDCYYWISFLWFFGENRIWIWSRCAAKRLGYSISDKYRHTLINY